MVNGLEKQSALKRLQLQQMYSASTFSLASSALLACLLAYIQSRVIASPVVLVWLSLIILITLARVALVIFYQRFPQAAPAAIHTQLARFRFGVLASGMVWGAAGFLLLPAHDTPHQLFLIFMLAGITTGGVVAYSADLFCTLGFTVATLSPIVARLFGMGDDLAMSMGTAIIVYLGFMILSGRNFNRHIVQHDLAL